MEACRWKVMRLAVKVMLQHIPSSVNTFLTDFTIYHNKGFYIHFAKWIKFVVRNETSVFYDAWCTHLYCTPLDISILNAYTNSVEYILSFYGHLESFAGVIHQNFT